MDTFLTDFQGTVERAAGRLRDLSPERAARRPAPGKWSAKEILGHLVDSASNNHQRFVRAAFRDDLEFPGYEQDRWVALQAYQDAPWPELVDLWSTFNLHLARLVAALPRDVLRLPRTRHNLHEIGWQPFSPDEPVTLEAFVRDYLGHLKYHLTQIERVVRT